MNILANILRIYLFFMILFIIDCYENCLCTQGHKTKGLFRRILVPHMQVVPLTI